MNVMELSGFLLHQGSLAQMNINKDDDDKASKQSE